MGDLVCEFAQNGNVFLFDVESRPNRCPVLVGTDTEYQAVG